MYFKILHHSFTVITKCDQIFICKKLTKLTSSSNNIKRISTRSSSTISINNKFSNKQKLNQMEDTNPILNGLDKNPLVTKYFNNIIKSSEDNREYRGLHLENGLKALLISDKTTDKSAAALTVDVGHLSDTNVLGLAHFCEHMLFLGTEKYPNENEYSSYLSEHGGTSNACTYADNTKYYFEIPANYLDGALDRFAQFFVSPLFTESATDREINAVHSEHEKNLANDVWRIRQVNKSLSDPAHPYSRFDSGNRKTLVDDPKKNGINVRDELIKFHGKWYSANIMCLAVYGKESLDELENMVIPKFSEIINKNVVAPKWLEPPFKIEDYAKKMYIVPIKDSRSLTITFQTGDLEEFYKSSPEQYLNHLLGHEGKGSILSELKNRGWCDSLMAGHSTSARGFGFFDIIVELTKSGFENINDIVKIVFQYIFMLQQESPKRWIFDEYCTLGEMTFRFKDKEYPVGLVSGIVHAMQVYPLHEVLTAPFLISEWRPDLITNLINELSPEKCRIIIVGQKIEPIAKETEDWYGTKYHVESISSEIIKEWKMCGLNENLKFPTPNQFIPTDFSLYPIDADVEKYPIIIHDTPVIRVWFKQDTEFLKPKCIMSFDFCSPMGFADPLNCNLTHMFVQLFKDQLNEYLYDVDLAGIKLIVSNTTNGISLSINGYNDKQYFLLQKVLDQMFNFEFDVDRFEIMKERLLRGLRNFRSEQPYQQAFYYLALLLTEHAWTKDELIDAVALITVERLQQFIRDFLSRMHVECLLHGNANKQRALELCDIVEQKLNSTSAMILPLLSRQLLLKREYKLGTAESYLFETGNEFHRSSCTELYLQCGQSERGNVFIDLVAQILTEPCYDTLRTKEQLGYIVFCGTRKVNGVQGIKFIVQSVKHPKFVEDRIENFLQCMKNNIENMSIEEFERHKNALAEIKLEKPKRLSMLFHKFAIEISLQQYHFNRSEVEVTILKSITKQQLLDYYKNFILTDGINRHALSIHIVSKACGGAAFNEINDGEETIDNDFSPEINSANLLGDSVNDKILITDLALFKSSKELFPIVQPYINIQPKGAKSKL